MDVKYIYKEIKRSLLEKFIPEESLESPRQIVGKTREKIKSFGKIQ